MTIVGQGLGDFYSLRESTGNLEQAQSKNKTASASFDVTAIFDDPLVQQSFIKSGNDGASKETTLLLEGVRCSACIWLLEKTLSNLPGMEAATVSYATRRAQIRWNPKLIPISTILRSIKQIGYEAWPADPRHLDILRKKERRGALWRLFVAGFGMMQVMMYALPVYLSDSGDMPWDAEQLMRWASLILTVPVILYSAGSFFKGALRDLNGGRAGMDVPIAMGIAIGFLASAYATVVGSGTVYFDSITMFIFLILSGRYLELLGRQKATQALDHLSRLMPVHAHRLPNGIEGEQPEAIPAAALRKGDLVLVKPGEALPADGILVTSEVDLSEALITGESKPVRRLEGASIMAGAVNIGGPFLLRVERIGSETVISSIERMVTSASTQRSRLIDIADRTASIFVLSVIALAAISAAFWWSAGAEKAIWVAVSVLVATCPCAFSLATPIALTIANGELVKLGIASGKGHLIETLARATDFILDKTGTVTQGDLTVTEVSALQNRVELDILTIAAALESRSEHPLARAFSRIATQKKLELPLVSEVRSYPGQGIEGFIAGQKYRIGTPEFVHSIRAGIQAQYDETPDQRMTGEQIVLGDSTGSIAMFKVVDALRSGAVETIKRIRLAGIRVHLISGDSMLEAKRVAETCGVDAWRGRVLPSEKQGYLTGLKESGRLVVMVGDGINDAPVLAAADASLAMGTGASLSQLSADGVILGGRFDSIFESVLISRKALRIIRQNLLWSFVYNLLVLPAAIAGWLSPWMAGLGMSFSSVIVVLNALRITRPNRPESETADRIEMRVNA